ncbi:family 43 glycosylhydrolase [Maribacter sp. LLG6340-A2]|uniref:family 43 glycosylhydrolase n=1 Tax=Maribacter sp. LLG6340-A2 TaxID=3160834 RepID=UPI00386F1277
MEINYRNKRKVNSITFLICVCCTLLSFAQHRSNVNSANNETWIADNGNGTFTNPLFYDEFSDPDLIRVGDDYYMTGTTMHTMPGLPLLHSKDLVNWSLQSYAVNELDLGPNLRLEDGKNAYGRGIWAPCLRYHNGTFYIFSNVNGYGTQLYSSKSPKGPWKHETMSESFHDMSVLFDDDGKIYAVWGYDEIRMCQLSENLLDKVPGTERVIVERGSGAGEGCHIYKIKGKYYITNTNWDPVCYQVCLRSDTPYGPYEINVMSALETFGEAQRTRIPNTNDGPPFKMVDYHENFVGRMPLHQGGIVQIQSGEWWGWSMLDLNSVGRVTAISPVTWEKDWPYFGLPGNLKRTPRTWVKPNTGTSSEPAALFDRNDDFNGPELKDIWQWNHVPVKNKWSLTSKGYLRLHALNASSFWSARNTLTQRAIGPESYAITKLNFDHLKNGDVSGLALLNLPYAWIGVVKKNNKITLDFYNQQTQERLSVPVTGNEVWLKAHCNFDTDIGNLSYSFNGDDYSNLGGDILMPYQGKTFQGVRYSLFNFNTQQKKGGYVDFDFFKVIEPRYKSLTRPIPYNKIIVLKSIVDNTVMVNWKNFLRPVAENSKFINDRSNQFKVLDRGNGRIALQSVMNDGFVTVKGKGGMAEVRIEPEDQGEASTFQWQDMLKDDLMLMSLVNHRYLSVLPNQESLCTADAPGARPDRKGGACFSWNIVEDKE